jgi:hypothetical protein
MPPDNGGYMVAAYVITALILGGYSAALWVRATRAVEAARRHGGTAEERAAG